VQAGPTGATQVKIGSIVIRCYEFEKMLAFWQEALHYVPARPAADGWVILRDPAGRGPTSTCMRWIEKGKWNGSSRSGPLAIRGDTSPTMTSLCWRTPTATSSASFRTLPIRNRSEKNA